MHMRDRVSQYKSLDSDQWRVNLELRDEELRAIGHVSAQWAFLESMLRRLTREVAKALREPLPQNIDSDSFRLRNAALRDLVSKMPADSDRDKLQTLLDRVGSLQGERHRLIHGLVEWDEADRDKLNVRTHKNPHGAPWSVTAKDIEAVADKISALNCAIWNWPNESPWETMADEVREKGSFFGGFGRENPPKRTEDK
jgi:hypothetical protein